MSQRAVLWCRSEMGNTEDLTRQNQVLSFYCKEQGMKAVRTIIEYGKADILKLRNFRQMARYDDCSSLKIVEFSEGTEMFYTYAFRYFRNLTTIVIPKSLTLIKNNVFEGTKLSTIYYCGSLSEWNKIEIDESISKKMIDKATIYFYSETKPTTPGNYWHYKNGACTTW